MSLRCAIEASSAFSGGDRITGEVASEPTLERRGEGCPLSERRISWSIFYPI
jgi:hypothetical protein